MRAERVAGVIVSAARFDATTVRANDPETPPVDALIVVVPGAMPVIVPSAPTLATVGFELLHAMASVRSSPAREKLFALVRNDWSTSNVEGCCSMLTSAAAPGSTVTCNWRMTGFCPGTSALMVTGIVLGAPARTSPVLSTVASNCAAACWNLMIVPATGRPAASTA